VQTDSEAATEKQVLDKRIRGPSETANEEPAGSTSVTTSTATDNHERPRTWTRR